MAKKYFNMYHVNNIRSFTEVLRWMRNRPKKALDFQVPQHNDKAVDYLKENRENQTITWIGHSTFLIQKGGLNIVTDPVWAKRLGMAKRLALPGLGIDEMPEIDIILISHGHYDHLDIASLRSLVGEPLLIVPEGLGSLLKRKGFTKIMELCWWEKVRIGEVEFHFVPAQHWTRRTLWDTNSSHWGGFIIRKAGVDEETIYFAGDSGYFRGFKEIGAKFDIHTAIMPIGAYEPEWFMQPSHMTPEESVQAFMEVGAELFIPMHYGAYMLADDTPAEALERLKQGWEGLDDKSKVLNIPDLGETIIYK